ncbi:serine/arginine repetitive matrix protein 2-like [Hordeum vulgare]|nr:serine/arginine repetitive matrix protein 2-like [Hordeum vulgare]
MRTSLSFRQRRRCRRNPRCSPPTRLSLGWRGLAKTSPVLKLALRLRLPGWNEYIATFLIGRGCSLDYIEPRSRHKEDTRDLSLSAWIADPSAIPKVKWLTLPAHGHGGAGCATVSSFTWTFTRITPRLQTTMKTLLPPMSTSSPSSGALLTARSSPGTGILLRAARRGAQTDVMMTAQTLTTIVGVEGTAVVMVGVTGFIGPYQGARVVVSVMRITSATVIVPLALLILSERGAHPNAACAPTVHTTPLTR